MSFYIVHMAASYGAGRHYEKSGNGKVANCFYSLAIVAGMIWLLGVET